MIVTFFAASCELKRASLTVSFLFSLQPAKNHVLPSSAVQVTSESAGIISLVNVSPMLMFLSEIALPVSTAAVVPSGAFESKVTVANDLPNEKQGAIP